jgi:hypothetical protein
MTRALVLLLVMAALGLVAPSSARAGAVQAGIHPWPRAVIPVWIDPAIRPGSPKHRKLERALKAWEAASGVRFVGAAPTVGPLLRVFNRPASHRCDARMGYSANFRHAGRMLSGGMMTLGECSYGSVLHETGHVLGLMHEHQRADRSGFISFAPVAAVLRACAGTRLGCLEAAANVGQPRATQLQSAYDPCSLMHYLADQSAKARAGRLPPSPGWARFYRLTNGGQANYRLCRARLVAVDGCGWWKTGQKCEISCQDANTVAVFHRLRPRRACWGQGPLAAAAPRPVRR